VLQLWIHELMHVEQYARLGIDSFANQYSIEWNRIENEAESNATRVFAQIPVDPPVFTTPVVPPVTPPVTPPATTTPIGTGDGLVWVRCFTPYGVSNYFRGVPGGPCYMETPWGRVTGIAQ
jgi:hypothetical protein